MQNNKPLKDKLIFLTGGSLGIGAVVAEKCAEAGARLIIASRTEKDLKSVTAKLNKISPKDHRFTTLDVSDKKSVHKAAEWVKNEFGHLDGLVNCAGVYGSIGPLNEIDIQEFVDAVNINFLGTVFTCHYFAPLLSGRNAKIVNYSGGGAATPFPNFSAYATSKTAVVRLSENLAEEYRPLGIAVNVIAPGFVVTRLHEKTLKLGEKAGGAFLEKTKAEIANGGVPPEKAANLTVFLLSDASAGINGKFLSAPWDPWEKPEYVRKLKEMKSLATLRRIDDNSFIEKNIVAAGGKDNTVSRMEKLNKCVLCGSEGENFHTAVQEKVGYNIVSCNECGLIFVNPRDSQDVVSKQYVEDQTSPISYYQQTAPTDTINFNKRLDMIESKVPKAKLLDIGCNVGTFMEAARQRGWQVAGVEANRKAADVCKEKGLAVHTGLFGPEFAKKHGQSDFDLVCMNDSIEHFPDPLEALSWARVVLKDNGYIAISTPNISSILGKVFQIKPKEHLFYFSKDTLRKKMEHAGYKVELLVEVGRRRDIAAMSMGASLDSKWRAVSKLLDRMGLAVATSIFLSLFFRDELFVLARKVKQ